MPLLAPSLAVAGSFLGGRRDGIALPAIHGSKHANHCPEKPVHLLQFPPRLIHQPQAKNRRSIPGSRDNREIPAEIALDVRDDVMVPRRPPSQNSYAVEVVVPSLVAVGEHILSDRGPIILDAV